MKEFLYVGIGGFLGSVTRFKTGSIFIHDASSGFPWGTLTVNVLGCFLAGLVAAILERLTKLNAEMRLLLITGFCGGFTTFSAFGIETLHLLKGGNTYLALVNVFLSVAAGLCAIIAGMKLGTWGL